MHHKAIAPSFKELHCALEAFTARRFVLGIEYIARTLATLGMPVTAQVYNELIRAHGASADYGQIDELMLHMAVVGVPPDIDTFNILLEHCIVANRPKVNRVYQALHDHGLVPNPKTFRLLLRFRCLEKNLDGVMKVIGDMKAVGIPLDVFACNSLLQLFAQSKDQKNVQKVWQVMREHRITPNVFTLQHLVPFFGAHKFNPVTASYLKQGILPDHL